MENCLYININFKYKIKKPQFSCDQTNFPSFWFISLIFQSFAVLETFLLKKCCKCRETIKMKTWTEGFVWWLSTVHRSLLGFLFDLEILKPQPVPGPGMRFGCAHLQGTEALFPALLHTVIMRLSPLYYLLELDQPPNYTHEQPLSSPCQKVVLLCSDGPLGLCADA